MLEWRREQEFYGKSEDNRNTLANWLCEDRAEPDSKTQQELSQAMQAMGTTPARKFFLVVCSKKY